jgi:hypothetical protein
MFNGKILLNFPNHFFIPAPPPLPPAPPLTISPLPVDNNKVNKGKKGLKKML